MDTINFLSDGDNKSYYPCRYTVEHSKTTHFLKIWVCTDFDPARSLKVEKKSIKP